MNWDKTYLHFCAERIELSENDNQNDKFYLFSKTSNRGFEIDGLASQICSQLYSGTKSVGDVVKDIGEKENFDQEDLFNNTSLLIHELEECGLAKLSDTAKQI